MPSPAANANGQYERSPSPDVVTDESVVVVLATGRIWIGAESVALAAAGLAARCATRAFALALGCLRTAGFDTGVADVATAAVRAFCRGAGGSGYGFTSSAFSACEVTQTGVCALVRE